MSAAWIPFSWLGGRIDERASRAGQPANSRASRQAGSRQARASRRRSRRARPRSTGQGRSRAATRQAACLARPPRRARFLSRPGPSSSISATEMDQRRSRSPRLATARMRTPLARPFARIVEQVADEIGQILRFAAEPADPAATRVERQGAVAVELLEGAHEAFDGRFHLGDAPNVLARAAARARSR